MKDAIRAIVLENGADVCGFANIERFHDVPMEYHPSSIWKDCRTVIVFGIALPKGFFEITSRLIYSHYNDLSIKAVDSLAFNAAKQIEEIGKIKAIPLPCDNPYEYWDKENMEGHGLISNKKAAYFAGLGSIGKNKLLINKKFGNRLTLGVILVDREIPSDDIPEELCLPNCQLCITSCPVGAITRESVIQKKCRLHTYGKTTRGFDTVECYQCRSVCPLRDGIKK